MTIIGCGIQGRAHAEALLRVRPITKVFAFDADPAAAARFAQHLGIEVVRAESIENAIAESDIVITCTPSRSPILGIEHSHPGLFIAGVGADNPEKNELAPALLAQSRVVAGHPRSGRDHGRPPPRHRRRSDDARRHPRPTRRHPLRPHRRPANDDEVFIFDSTGTALQDVATASIALTRAMERNIGVDVAFTQSPSA